MQELVNKLCASPAIAGATLLAAFEQPGTTAANNAVAASIQSCPGSDDDWLGRLYMRTANPDGDHSDGSQTVRWAAAATRDVAGEIEWGCRSGARSCLGVRPHFCMLRPFSCSATLKSGWQQQTRLATRCVWAWGSSLPMDWWAIL